MSEAIRRCEKAPQRYKKIVMKLLDISHLITLEDFPSSPCSPGVLLTFLYTSKIILKHSKTRGTSAGGEAGDLSYFRWETSTSSL